MRAMKKCIVGFIVVGALAIVGAPGTARAEGDGFGELALGLSSPVGEDEYSDNTDTSFKVALQAGTFDGKSGLELHLAWSPVEDDFPDSQFASFDANRVRLLVGGRLGTNIKRTLGIYLHVLGGLDYVHTSSESNFLGTENTSSDFGLGLEVGGGVKLAAGPVTIGAQLGVPMAFHFDDDKDAGEFDVDYNLFDLDVLFTVGSAF